MLAQNTPRSHLKRKLEEFLNGTGSGAIESILREFDDYAKNVWKLPESEMPPYAPGDNTHPQQVANAVVCYFVDHTANDDSPEGTLREQSKQKMERKNANIPRKADVIRLGQLQEMLAVNGIVESTTAGRMINNAMENICNQKRKRPRVKTESNPAGTQVAGFYGVRFRDFSETDTDRQLRRESLQLAKGESYKEAWRIVVWWRKVAAAEGSKDSRARQCRLIMLSEIALKLAREGLCSIQTGEFKKLLDIGKDPERWAQIMEEVDMTAAPSDGADSVVLWRPIWDQWSTGEKPAMAHTNAEKAEKAAKKKEKENKAKAKAKAKAKEEKAKAKLKGVARLLKEERKEAAEDASSRAEREAEAAILRAEHEAAEVEAAKRRTERTEQLEAEMLSDSGSQSRSQSRDDSQSQSRSPIDCFENQLNAKAAATSRSPDEAYAADKKSATGAPGLEIVPFHTGLASGDALAELEEILMAELEEILINGTTEEKISTSTVSQVKAIIDANALLFCLNKSLPTNNLAEPGPSGDEMIKRLCCVREWLANQDFPLSSLLTQLQTDYALTGKGKLINMIKFVQNAEDYSDFMSKQEASGATPKLPHSKTSKKEKALRDWMTKQGKRLGKATLTWENPVEMYALLEIVETYPEVDIFSDPEISDKVRDRPQNIPKLQSGPGFLRETVTMERHDMCSPALKAPEAAATWTQGEHTEFGGVKFPSDGGVKNQGVDQEELD